MPIHASARHQHLATHPPCSRPRPRCPQGRRWQSLRAGWIPSGFCRRICSGRALAQILLKRKNRRQVALPNLVIPSPAGCCWRLRHAAISSPRFFEGGGKRGGAAQPHGEHPAPSRDIATTRRAKGPAWGPRGTHALGRGLGKAARLARGGVGVQVIKGRFGMK